MEKDEAELTWCPVARADDPSPRTFAGEKRGNNCIHFYCAMWRWKERSRTLGYCGFGARPVDDE